MGNSEELLNSFREFHKNLSQQSEISATLHLHNPLDNSWEGGECLEGLSCVCACADVKDFPPELEYKYDEKPCRVFDIYLNIDEEIVKTDGLYDLVVYSVEERWEVLDLENLFRNPLKPTSIELEEFFLEIGIHYPISEEQTIVDPVTGKPLSSLKEVKPCQEGVE